MPFDHKLKQKYFDHKLEQEYCDRFGSDEQAILADARTTLVEKVAIMEFEAWEEKAKELKKKALSAPTDEDDFADNIATMLLEETSFLDSFFFFKRYCELTLHYHYFALKNANIPTTNLDKIVIDFCNMHFPNASTKIDELKTRLSAEANKIYNGVRNIKTSLPETYLSMENNAVNAMTNTKRQKKALSTTLEGQLFFEDVDILAGRKNNINVNNQLSIWYDKSVTFDNILNLFDRSILNTLFTLCNNKQRIFTLTQLYRVMVGDNAAKLADSMATDIKNSLDKFCSTKYKLNVLEQAEQLGLKWQDGEGREIETTEFEGRILSLTKGIFKVNGQLIEAYSFDNVPNLFKYAEATNQIARTSKEAFALGLGQKNTMDVIEIRQYLIDEVYRINSKKHNNTILFSSIYEQVIKKDESAKTREKHTKRIREATYSILDSFVNAGNIKAYKEKMSGRKIEGIEIIL